MIRRALARPYLTLGILALALLGVRLASAMFVSQPGYTDAYYYATAAGRLARGEGLTVDLVWNWLEAPGLASLPIASHRFWMPLASVLQAAGIALAGGPLGDFRAAQAAVVAVAAAIPLVTFAAARSLGSGTLAALAAAAVAGLGGAFAPAWVSLDSFAPAAVIGTLFFIAFGHAARGSVVAGLLAGALCGALYLARAEAALFGVPLLILALRRTSRGAGIAGSAVALAIGLAWLARSVALGVPSDLLARSLFLVRYQDFFALEPPTLASWLAAPEVVLNARIEALVTNAATAAVALLLVPLVPLAFAARDRWRRPEVRVFVGLALGVYLVQSLVFAPHSIRGSWFHSLAAFFPFGMALAAAGIEDLFARSRAMQRTAFATAVLAFGLISAFSVAQWDVDFNTPYRARLAVVALLPPGPVVAADAAAWRWIAGRSALLAPSDSERAATCVAAAYGAATLILEPAHFSAYDALYSSQRSDLFTVQAERGGIRLYSIRTDRNCTLAIEP